MTREAILKETLLIPSEDRIRLLDELWQSFVNDEEAITLTPAQAEDLQRRIAEDDAGLSNAQPWEVVGEQLLKRS